MEKGIIVIKNTRHTKFKFTKKSHEQADTVEYLDPIWILHLLLAQNLYIKHIYCTQYSCKLL